MLEETTTNSIAATIDDSPILQEAANKVEQALHLPVPILLILVLNGIAIIIRKSKLPNWTISIIILAIGSVAYPLLSSAADTMFKSTQSYVLILQGAFLALASLGVDLILEKFSWYRDWTKSISEDKRSGIADQKAADAATDLAKQEKPK